MFLKRSLCFFVNSKPSESTRRLNDYDFNLLKEDFSQMTLNLASILPQNNAYTFFTQMKKTHIFHLLKIDLGMFTRIFLP